MQHNLIISCTSLDLCNFKSNFLIKSVFHIFYARNLDLPVIKIDSMSRACFLLIRSFLLKVWNYVFSHSFELWVFVRCIRNVCFRARSIDFIYMQVFMNNLIALDIDTNNLQPFDIPTYNSDFLGVNPKPLLPLQI